jgi:hypothetical protein
MDTDDAVLKSVLTLLRFNDYIELKQNHFCSRNRINDRFNDCPETESFL